MCIDLKYTNVSTRSILKYNTKKLDLQKRFRERVQNFYKGDIYKSNEGYKMIRSLQMSFIEVVKWK